MPSGKPPKRKIRDVLSSMLQPRSVTVIGTSWQSPLFLQVLNNLSASKKHLKVWPVILESCDQDPLCGIDERVDLAILATPVEECVPILRHCEDAGIPAALLLQSPQGTRAERARVYQQLRAALDGMSIRVLGPNSVGLMMPADKLNASVMPGMALPGSVAFLSQSGTLCNAILDWSLREQIGFSVFVSLGAMVDVGWGELLTWLGDHPTTRSIIIYMESIGDARALLSAARETTLGKPVIVIKAGKNFVTAQAVAGHSYHAAGDDAVLDAAFRRIGVLRVETIAELFYMAEVLSRQPLPGGNRLMIVSNSGSAGVLAADALTARGGAPGRLPEQATKRLHGLAVIPEGVGGPVDVGEDADAERYAEVLKVVREADAADGTLVIFAPTIFARADEIAEQVRSFAKAQDKPVLASWIGGSSVEKGTALLESAGIPTFPYPDTAAKIFNSMWRYAYNLRGIYETPALVESLEISVEKRRDAGEIIANFLAKGESELPQGQARVVLQAYGVRSVKKARKSDSETVFPCSLSSFVDPDFGPVIRFFAGLNDSGAPGESVLALPPLNTTLARRMLEQTHFYQNLKKDDRIDFSLLEDLLVGFSRLLSEQPRIRVAVLSPLHLHIDSRARAIPEISGCSIRLFPGEVPEEELPHPAIRPYPVQYVGEWRLRDGTPVRIRPIRPEDEPKFVAFHRKLSDQSVYFRYFHTIQLDQRIAHERLSRICFVDYDREIALVVEQLVGSGQNIIAVGRLIRAHGDDEAEFAILVADAFQRSGIGTELLRRLVKIGRDEGLAQITAKILPENRGMLEVCRRIGFETHFNSEEEVFDAVIRL